MYEVIFFTVSLVAVTISWIWYRKRVMSTWKRLGVPGPKPNFIQGNCLEIREKGLPACQIEWTQLYGKVYGYYVGGTPYLVIGDIDLAKEILKTNFDVFPNRPVSSNGFMIPVGMETKQLIFQNNIRWKTQRFNWKTFFNPKNIEEIFPYLDSVVREFLSQLELKDEVVDVYALYQRLTMVVIARILLGADTSDPGNHNHPSKVVETFRTILTNKSRKFPISIACFPEFDFITIPIIRLIEIVKNLLNKSQVYNFISDFKEFIVKNQSRNNNQPIDFVTKMLGQKVPVDTLVADCFALLFGGFETISVTLLHATRVLLKESQVQQRLRDAIEVEKYSDASLTYSKLSEMRYLDAVVKEVLRCYNPVPGFIRRQSISNFHLNGVKLLEKGSVVQIPMAVLHKSEDHWENPSEFNPERFLTGKGISPDSLTFAPFGAGKRNCVAMHFAMITMKLILYRLISEFHLAHEDDVTREIPTKNSIIRMMPKSGLKVKLRKN